MVETATDKRDAFRAFHPKRRRSSELEVVNERRIGSGKFGNIFEADVFVSGDLSDNEIAELKQKNPGRYRSLLRKFVIKKFNDTEQDGSVSQATAEENAKKAIENYVKAKKAGVKVFSTYRLSDNQRDILMTNGDSDDYYCIGSNKGSNTVVSFGGEMIESKNTDEVKIEEFIKSVFYHAQKSAEKKVALPFDAYFFKIGKNEKDKLDFVIGDLDMVRFVGFSFHHAKIYMYNFANALTALNSFFAHNFVAREDSANYGKLAEDMYSRYMTENQLWNV